MGEARGSSQRERLVVSGPDTRSRVGFVYFCEDGDLTPHPAFRDDHASAGI